MLRYVIRVLQRVSRMSLFVDELTLHAYKWCWWWWFRWPLLFIMHSCQSCGKSFSRNDSLRRHQRQYCNVIMPRWLSKNRSLNGTQKVVKSTNLIDYSSLDFIQILTSMMNEQRYRWRNYFKKRKDALLPTEKYDSSADEEPDSTDDDHCSNNDKAHSSSEWCFVTKCVGY